MTLTILHNPKCSKSRQTLEILENRGLKPTIVHYLDEPPSAATVRRIATLLNTSVHNLMRTGETDYREADDLPDTADDAALAHWLERHPKVLQRPIVIDEERERAVIGRPPENVLTLLDRD